MADFDSRAFLVNLTQRPGVYRMCDKAGKVLYVGKAKNLKHRVSSYFRETTDTKTRQLVSQIASIDITVTPSENEALLLENSLIKSLKPRYNVIFKDDKSYPYLFVSKHTFPRLVYFRGKQKIPGHYYGPYPSAHAVKETLTILQKLFKLRQCDDTFFKLRSRPCLQYQIQRCSAPCVGYISPDEYAQDVNNVILFLEGKESRILDLLVSRMQSLASDKAFEKAAIMRDQIAHLRNVFDQQVVHKQKGNADVIVVAHHQGHFCIQLLYIRQGQILDSQSFFPKQTGDGLPASILRRFLIQFYLDKENKIDFPNTVLINHEIDDQTLIESSIASKANVSIRIQHVARGQNAKWLTLALESANSALSRKNVQLNMMQKRFMELKKVLGLSANIEKVECFDISHSQGEATMASCVVFSSEGAQKSEYRSYTMDVVANDDYAAMEQVLTKRYMKMKAEDGIFPDIIMVDGGKGQLNRAKKALLECQVVDFILIAIAKGEGRKPGLETLFVCKSIDEPYYTIKLPPTSQALHLLQQIRDESHRLAITSHRKKSRANRKRSPLESIPGVGPKRRQDLLSYFGGLQGLMGASEEAIANVPNIGTKLAKQIYSALHGEV